MKYELGGKIMKEIAVLKVKIYSNLRDNNNEDKKNQRHKSNIT